MVSVVITTYKRNIEVLQRALESVLRQTYKDFELIIVNDNPDNDNANEFIEKFIQDNNNDNRIEYIHLEKNSGACVARNIGAQKATGEYIAFLDDDDEWYADKLEKQVAAISCNNNCSLVTGYVILDNKIIYNQGMEYQGNVIEKLLAGNFIGGSSVPLIRKDIFDIVGGFDEKYLSSQDYNLWIKLAKKGEIIFLKSPLIRYYMSNDSITGNTYKRMAGWKMILKDFKEDYIVYPKSFHRFVYTMCEQLKSETCVYRFSCLKFLFQDLWMNGINREWIVSVLRILHIWTK